MNWIKKFFVVLFSREIWFSWFFLIFEGLMLLEVFQSPTPFLQLCRAVGFLVTMAFIFTVLAFIIAFSKKKLRNQDG